MHPLFEKLMQKKPIKSHGALVDLHPRTTIQTNSKSGFSITPTFSSELRP